MCCTHLEIWQDSLGEVKIKMSERKKLCHLTLKGAPWDECQFLEMHWLLGQVWQQNLVLLLGHAS